MISAFSFEKEVFYMLPGLLRSNNFITSFTARSKFLTSVFHVSGILFEFGKQVLLPRLTSSNYNKVRRHNNVSLHFVILYFILVYICCENVYDWLLYHVYLVAHNYLILRAFPVLVFILCRR